MGRGFGYNQNESDADLETADGLVRLLVDVVSRNGNLLLNVGPMADGTVPAAQVNRLRAIGTWLGVNGEGIFGTRPWTRAEGVTGDGTPVRFTTSGDGNRIYAAVMGTLPADAVTLIDVGIVPSAVRLLGSAGTLPATASGSDLRISLPAAPEPQPVHVFELSR
jgi:alpha-L-fucosidase